MSTDKNPVEWQSEPEGAQPQPGAVEKLKKSDLIKANEALEILQFFVGGRPAAKKLLVDLISDGELRAYAGRQWTTTKKGIKAAWKAGPPEDAVKQERIKSGVFAGSSVLDEDRKRWRWKRNRFHVTHVKRGGKILRYFYRGVRFERSAIHEVLTHAKTSLIITHKGGRGIDEHRWSVFWLQLLGMQRDGSFDEASLGEFLQFRKTFLDAYCAQIPKVDRLADDTIDGQLRKAYECLAKP